MITLKDIKALKNNDGLTLKKYNTINYKTGWQVATTGVECANAKDAYKAIKDYKGNCGVWLSNGIYYIDNSFRVNTKKQALQIGKENNQISVFGWARQNLAYC